MTRLLPLLLLGAIALSGCSSYDPGALDQGLELQSLSRHWAGERAHPGSILLAPIPQPQLSAPDPEDLRGAMQLQTGELEQALVGSLGRVLAEGQRVERTPTGVSPEDYALKQGFDAILYVEVRRWNALFVENTGWWYPNALFLGWYFWPFGAWTIADEVYGIDCALELTLRDAASGRLIEPLERRLLELVSGPELSRPPSAEEVAHLPRLTLSDGERGLDFFGTWAPGSLDPDQWAEVSLLLQPYALRHASVRVAATVAKTLSDDLARGSRDERYATAHAVLVGINEYGADPCPGARADGEALRDLLQGVAPASSAALSAAPWLPERNLDAFFGAQASVAEVTSALRGAARRARAEDSLVFYFSGRGQAAKGSGLAGLELLCADGALSLAEVAAAIQDSPARRRLIFLDCDFKGGGSRGRGPPSPQPAAELRAALGQLLLSGSRGAGLVVLACDPCAPEEHAQSYAFEAGQERGLLTTFLLRALAGEADTGGDGLSAQDVAAYVVDRVENLSEVATEAPQRPLVVTQDAAAVIRPGGR